MRGKIQLLIVTAALVAPAAASADTAPVISAGPTIAGTPRAGEMLTASATWTGDPAPTAKWAWLRCLQSKPNDCKPIAGATAQTYLVVAADVGFLLRVRLTVTNKAGNVKAGSSPTAVVEPALPPPTPTPTPPPTPSPTPPPSPTPSPPVESPAIPIPGPPSAGADVLSTPLLTPFPVVRIRGRLTRAGARVTLLSVRAPRGALIAVRCRGTSCPVRRLARTASLTRLKPFERRLRGGTRLDITVRKAGYVGKWTTIFIRRGHAPRRADRCVRPNETRPVACPLS